MYAMAALWTFRAETVEEALYVHKKKVMPALEARPGYVRSLIVRSGRESLLSVVCWDSEDDATRAMEEIVPLVIKHLGHLVRGVERFPGPVAYEGSTSRRPRVLNGAAPAPAIFGRLRGAVRRGSRL